MLVGREPELAQLRELLADDRAVVIVGEAGVGKTTLMRAAADATGRPVFEGGGLSTLSWMDGLALRRAIGRPNLHGDATVLAAEVERVVGAGVLLVDDMQWADPVTADAMPQLAGRTGLLAGVRRGDPRADAALDRLREAGFVQIDLRPLTPEQAVTLLAATHPGLTRTSVDRLIIRTGGNPLLLRELAATGEPSASLRLALAAHLRRLDVAGRDAFGMLALAGRPVSLDDLGHAGAQSLLDADLAVLGPAGVEVRHSLLGEVAIDQMPAGEKRSLHARIARGVDDDAEAARHYALAGETELAYAAALRAAETAAGPSERATHLALAAACADGPEADDLRLRAARAQEQAHDWPGMVATLGRISSADPQVRARAALLRARGAWTGGDVESLRVALAEGLALVAGTGTEVEVGLRIEQTRLPIFVEGDVPGGLRMAGEALALAEQTGFGQARAEYFYGTAAFVADDAGCEEHLLRAIALARAEGDLDTEMVAAGNLISFHESAGSPQRGRQLGVEVVARARAAGLGLWERAFRVPIAGLDFHAGEYQDVLTSAEELFSRPLEERARAFLLELYCMTLIDVGRIDEATRRMIGADDVSATGYQTTMATTWVLAEAALWGGQPLRALSLLEDYFDAPQGDPNLVFGFVTRAWARFDAGQDPGAPAGEQTRPMLRAVPPETEGLHRMYVADNRTAAAAFDRAAALWAPYHLRGELRCAWAAAEALRRAGDVEPAVARLEQVEARAVERGMVPLLTRIHRSLRAAGQRRSAPRVKGGAHALSARERTVLSLVGGGLTNAEIAGRLGVSRHTVSSQLSSASAKLGAANRGQAAALAAELGAQ